MMVSEVKMALPKLFAFAYSWTSKAHNKQKAINIK